MHTKSLLVILFGIHSLYSAPTKLSLEDCIKISHEKSTAANIAFQEYRSRDLEYDSFTAGFLPQISLVGSVPGLERAINQITQPDGTQLFIPQSQLFSNLSLTMSQKIPFTGANLFVSSGLSRIDILENNENFFWRTSPVQLMLIQPLFGHNTQKWDLRIEDMRHSSSARKYFEQMETISMDVVRRYFNLYIAQITIENARKNVAANDTLYTISKGRYNVGKIAENDLLQSELQLLNSQNELENALLDFRKAMDELKIAIGIELGDEIELIPPTDIPEFKVDIDLAVEQAKNNRSDYLEYEMLESVAERDLSIAESESSFQASLNASFGLNQTAGTVPSAYKDLLDQERLNIGLEIPLFQWGKGTSQIESAKAYLNMVKDDADLKKKNLEINVKYEALSFTRFQRQVSISAKADTIATRRFEVAKNRYLIGKIDLNTFFIAQNEKDRALQQYIDNLRDFWTAYYNLRRLTLYDFERGEKISY